MKRYYNLLKSSFSAWMTLSLGLFVSPFVHGQTSDSWTQKAPLTQIISSDGAPPEGRNNAVGFSIAGKGYIGTGEMGVTPKQDFWEYDPATDTWTQKADFAGGARSGAVGFSIGNKGYIGTGGERGVRKADFWEYDPSTNVWTQKADFAGGARSGAVGFSIGNKGYVGTGGEGSVRKADFWEYDPSTNVWTQKADFAGTARAYATGFSIGNKGYLGTGSSMGLQTDFWEYDQATDKWTKKADFAGGERSDATGFSIGNKGYLGTGYDPSARYGNPRADFWEYDPINDMWTKKADFAGGARAAAVGFSIGTKGYLGTGIESPKDFMEYDPTIDSWLKKTNLGNDGRIAAVGFSIGHKGYVGTGNDGRNFLKDFWEYDPATDTWTQKADFAGGARSDAVGFSIGNKGYVGTGTGSTDLWEYDPTTNIWTKKADFPGGARYFAIGFSIGSKGYIGVGSDGAVGKQDFWEYEPGTDKWTQKADFAGGIQVRITGFSIADKGYVGTRDNTNNFWEYNPKTDIWTKKADFPGPGRYEAVGFSIGNKGYMGTGAYGFITVLADFWEYDPVADSWTQKANFAGSARYEAVGFSIAGKGYVGTGSDWARDFWEYTPTCTNPTATVSGGGTVCQGVTLPNVSIALTGAAPWSVTYYNGSTSTTVSDISTTPYIITQAPAGTYTVTAMSDAVCSGTASGSATVTVNALPTAMIMSNNSPICADVTASFIVNGTNGATLNYTLTGMSGNQMLLLNGTDQSISANNAAVDVILTLVSVTDLNTCSQNLTERDTVKILAPAVPTSPMGGLISQGQSISLTANGCSGAGFTLLWYKSLDNVLVTMPVSPTVTTLYYARCQQSLGATSCLSDKTADVIVTVGQRIFVNAANANPTPDGTSWNNAFANLQNALSAARNSVFSPIEIWVAQGTYKPGTLRKDVFAIPSGVKIYGGFVGTEEQLTQRNWTTHLTLLSGEIGTVAKNDNSHHVVLFSATNDSTRLDGFTVKGGYAEFYAGNGNVNLNDPDILTAGGGILAVDKSKGLITHCILTDNRASGGGGMMLRDSSHLSITQSILWGNEANFGGGVYVLGGSKPYFENVLMANNKGLGGGLYVNKSQPTLINCTIASNKDEGNNAGGIYNANAVTTVKNSILWGNSPTQSNSGSVITYSLVEGGYAGTGNKNLDPQFVSPNAVGLAPTGSLGNYHLQPCSAGIDAADNASAPLADLEGNARPYPVGLGIADMGVYESQSSGSSGPNNLSVTENITSGTVLKVGGKLTATNRVSNATVVYQATKSVTLNAGFSATAGAGNSFLALIGGCL